MIGFLGNLFGKKYTIGDLMNVDQGRQSRAQGCKVSLLDTFFIMKEETLAQKFRALFSSQNKLKVFYIVLKLSVTSDTGHTHTVFIQIEPDFSLSNYTDNQVKLYCDCQDFKYRSAYTLKKRDSLFANDLIKIKLGEALTKTPTKQSTTPLCKHCYAALEWLLQNYESIMRTL